jgi:hypothetical protein
VDVRPTIDQPHVPAPAPLEEEDELVEAMRRMLAANSLDWIATSVTRSSDERAPAAAAAKISRAALFQDLDAVLDSRGSARDAHSNAVWQALWGEAVERWADSHRGWTSQEVVDRYGPADFLRTGSEGPSLVYASPLGSSAPATFVFQTREGKICGVDVGVMER